MTAIEYVKMVIGATIADGHTKMRATQFLMLIDKAKEIERNQIIRAVNYCEMKHDELKKQAIEERNSLGELYYDKMIKDGKVL